ncbi:mycothione reductase [Microlunatus ginsengisoli]|uniref:Mycothione reductase n=1 Tax=Microlunatus ginsengisoli TaxID=363863 RepID=A0ABP6ZHA3_9ACTN
MPRAFDLCIIGSGSGNTIVDERFRGMRTAIVDSGRFGGTCLNVGCIPTKMYVYPADVARAAQRADRLGLSFDPPRVDWPGLRDRIFGRVDAISSDGERGRRADPDVTVFTGEARFTGPRRLRVGEETITAERIVIAAGSRPVVPDLPGLSDVAFHTSDTVMRLDRLPASMLILGGGYVAAEFAHVFSALGAEVTVVNRSARLLGHTDLEVSQRFTALLGERLDVRLSSRIERIQRIEPVDRDRDTATCGVLASIGGESPGRVEAEVVLVATGRVPNGDRFDLAAAGVDVDDDGFVVVDRQQRTTADGVFALGDVCSARMLKHVANHEARVVQHNLLHPTAMIESDHRYVPQAVFSDPQVASVGLTEQQARDRGTACVVGRADYGDTAYGWAMEDERHFVKVLADPDSGLLLGAHLIGPQASNLVQPLVQGMSFGIAALDLARGQYWPHPAMSEVVENALLDLPFGR